MSQEPGPTLSTPKPEGIASTTRKRRFAVVAAAMLLALLVPQTAEAWLPEGHLATGAIAFDALERRHPEAVAAILRLMQSHPERAWLDRYHAEVLARIGPRVEPQVRAWLQEVCSPL